MSFGGLFIKVKLAVSNIYLLSFFCRQWALYAGRTLRFVLCFNCSLYLMPFSALASQAVVHTFINSYPYNKYLQWNLPQSQLAALLAHPELTGSLSGQPPESGRLLIALYSNPESSGKNGLQVSDLVLCQNSPFGFLFQWQESIPLKYGVQVTTLGKALNPGCDQLRFSDNKAFPFYKIPDSRLFNDRLYLIELHSRGTGDSGSGFGAHDGEAALKKAYRGIVGSGGAGDDGPGKFFRPGGGFKQAPLYVIAMIKAFDKGAAGAPIQTRISDEGVITGHIRLQANEESVILLVQDDEGNYYQTEQPLSEIEALTGEKIDVHALPATLKVYFSKQPMVSAGSDASLVKMAGEIIRFLTEGSFGIENWLDSLSVGKSGAILTPVNRDDSPPADSKEQQEQMSQSFKTQNKKTGQKKIIKGFFKKNKDGKNPDETIKCQQCDWVGRDYTELKTHTLNAHPEELEQDTPVEITLEDVVHTLITKIHEMRSAGKFQWHWLYPYIQNRYKTNTEIAIGFENILSSPKNDNDIFNDMEKLLPTSTTRREKLVNLILSLFNSDVHDIKSAGKDLIQSIKNLLGEGESYWKYTFDPSMLETPVEFSPDTFTTLVEDTALVPFFKQHISGMKLQISDHSLTTAVQVMVTELVSMGALKITLADSFTLPEQILKKRIVKDGYLLKELLALAGKYGDVELKEHHIVAGLLVLTNTDMPELGGFREAFMSSAIDSIVGGVVAKEKNQVKGKLLHFKFMVSQRSFSRLSGKMPPTRSKDSGYPVEQTGNHVAGTGSSLPAGVPTAPDPGLSLSTYAYPPATDVYPAEPITLYPPLQALSIYPPPPPPYSAEGMSLADTLPYPTHNPFPQPDYSFMCSPDTMPVSSDTTSSQSDGIHDTFEDLEFNQLITDSVKDENWSRVCELLTNTNSPLYAKLQEAPKKVSYVLRSLINRKNKKSLEDSSKSIGIKIQLVQLALEQAQDKHKLLKDFINIFSDPNERTLIISDIKSVLYKQQ